MAKKYDYNLVHNDVEKQGLEKQLRRFKRNKARRVHGSKTRWGLGKTTVRIVKPDKKRIGDVRKDKKETSE